MKLILTAGLSLSLLADVSRGQTSLSTGDISLLSMYADSSDSFSFVTWVGLSPGTTIKFTDNGWSNTVFRVNEGGVTWSNNTGGTISPGTVIIVTNMDTTTIFTDLGSATRFGSPDFSASGDQLFAYQGADSSPTFLFALVNKTGWDPLPITSSNNSTKPAALTDFETALLLGTNGWAGLANTTPDNSQYIGPRTGLTVTQYKAAIADPSNWEYLDTRTGSFAGSPSSVDFVIIPEPATIALVGTAFLGLWYFRRRQ
jgi:hypothetical protein